jgi:hypothetical protein
MGYSVADTRACCKKGSTTIKIAVGTRVVLKLVLVKTHLGFLKYPFYCIELYLYIVEGLISELYPAD